MSWTSEQDHTFRLIGTLAVGLILLFTVTYVPPGPGYDLTLVYSAYGYPVLLITVAIMCLIYIFRHQHLVTDIGITGIFVGLLVQMVLSTVLNLSSLRWVLPVVAWHSMIYIILFFTVIDLSISIREYEHYLSLFIIAFGIMSAIIALYTGFVSNISLGPLSVAQGTSDRFFGWYGNPNRLGSMIGVAILCSLKVPVSTSSTKRWFYLTPLVVFIPALALSESHGAMVSTMAAMVILLIFHSQYAKTAAVIGIWTSLFVFATLLFLAGIGELSTLLHLIDPDNIVEPGSLNIRDRFVIWSNLSWILADASPLQILFGHGDNYFIMATGRSPHNGYVRSLVNYGIVFLLGLTVLVWNILRWTLWSIGKKEFDFSLFFSFVVYLLLKDIPSQSTFLVRFEGFLLVATLIPFAVVAIRESRNRQACTE